MSATRMRSTCLFYGGVVPFVLASISGDYGDTVSGYQARGASDFAQVVFLVNIKAIGH